MLLIRIAVLLILGCVWSGDGVPTVSVSIFSYCSDLIFGMDAHDLAPMDHSDADSGHPATVEEEDVDEKSHLEVTADCRCARLVVLNPVDPAVLYASDFFTSTTADSFITFQPLRV